MNIIQNLLFKHTEKDVGKFKKYAYINYLLRIFLLYKNIPVPITTTPNTAITQYGIVK